MSELLALGLSHRTAPVAVRERLAATTRQTEELLARLVAGAAVEQAVVLSTCNRTELYLVVSDPVQAEADALGLIAGLSRIPPVELARLVYAPRGGEAVRHLYRVTSGLDSMVVGEHEIQGQVKRAYDLALRCGSTGPLLNQLLMAALRTGKRVRAETRIAAGRASVSSVAVDLAAEAVGDLAAANAMIVGAGETAELTAQALALRGVRTLFVSNRHVDRARTLAARFHGTVGRLDDLPAQLETADIVISSTGSPHTVLGPETLASAVAARRAAGNYRPLLLIDIAVPRDIDPGCAAVEGVTLHDLDDLQALVARNVAGRADEVEPAEQIVEQELRRFARWRGQLGVTPTIADLRARAAGIVNGVLDENAGRWEAASDADLERVERVAQTVIQRLLHEPTVRLKRARDHDDAIRVDLLRELFGLDDAAEGTADAPLASGAGTVPARIAWGAQEPRTGSAQIVPLVARSARSGTS